MATFGHSRSSSETSSSSGSQTHQLILDHILSYPGTYELPLRTMYTLNCTPRAQPMPTLRPNLSATSSASSSPVSPTFSPADQASQQFTSSLMAEMSQMPSQPTSLPPSFITSFARKCFAPDLRLVDFPQALTSLDYLRDLESRRRREVGTAFDRLGICRDTLGTAEDQISARFPGVLAWFRSVEDKERRIETLYTQLYVGLRRWVCRVTDISKKARANFDRFSSMKCLFSHSTSTIALPCSIPCTLLSSPLSQRPSSLYQCSKSSEMAFSSTFKLSRRMAHGFSAL